MIIGIEFVIVLGRRHSSLATWIGLTNEEFVQAPVHVSIAIILQPPLGGAPNVRSLEGTIDGILAPITRNAWQS